MNVLDIMITQPVSVEADASIESALARMEERGFWHLPVVRNGRLTGMVSDTEARAFLKRNELARHPRPMSAEFRRRFEPKSSMAVDSIAEAAVCIAEHESLSLAAWRMLEADVRALCVAEGDRLIGFLTASDLLRAYEQSCRSRTIVPAHVSGAGEANDPPVDRCMTVDADRLDGEEHLGAAVLRILGSTTRDFPVITDGRFVGMLCEPALRANLSENEGGNTATATKVSTVMSAPALALDRGMPLSRAAQEMVKARVTALPVVGGDEFVGLITQTDVLEHCATALASPTLDNEVETLLRG